MRLILRAFRALEPIILRMVHRKLTWFLTYPRCDLSPSQLLDHLCTLGSIKEYVIAHELHEDGGNHLHAYVKFDLGILASRMSCFDCGDYHGNYQACRSPAAVIKYCTKEDDYITNINIKSYLGKKGKVTVETLKTKNVTQALTDGDISFTQVRAYKYARFELAEAYTPSDLRGVWIWGKAGIGKTRAVREKYPDLFVKSMNKWWDGYDGQKVVLLDDMDKKGECLSHYLKIWADRYSCTGEIKGGNVQLAHDTFVITSNYEIEDIFGGDVELCRAIRRRFRVIHMTHPSLDIEAPVWPVFLPAMDPSIAN